jgi:mono/diheme cytochrome c family protein
MAATDQHYRNQKTLDIVFAVSCVLMLVTTIWMFVQDYNREFKKVQRDFRDVEAIANERQMLDRLPNAEKVEEKLKTVDDARKAYKDAQDKLAQAARNLQAKRDKQDDRTRTLKADFDAKTSYLVQTRDALSVAEGAEKTRLEQQKADQEKELATLGANLAAAQAELEKIDAEIKKDIRQKKVEVTLGDSTKEMTLDELDRALSDAEDDMKRLTGEFDRFAKTTVQKTWKAGDTFRNLPILDAFASPTRINQIVLPELTIDYNFKDVPRYDRCMTCHLGIDRAMFDRDTLRALGHAPEDLAAKLKTARDLLDKRAKSGENLGYDVADLPTTVRTKQLTPGQVTMYAAHPRLDLFVEANSPHPSEKFGCTICHSGQGSATEFGLASHTPADVRQAEEWKKTYDWKSNHYWDFPMYSNRFTESSCLKCHHQVADLVRSTANRPEAPKVLRGFDLIRENGCFGCHEISGTKSGRPIGPDLRLEPSPALEWLTPAEQDKVKADTLNPPGTYRKVGPSLRRITEKTNQEWARKWIQSPRGFRDDTKMPHFYGLSTNNRESLKQEREAWEKATGKTDTNPQDDFPEAEIHSIAFYLFSESKGHLKAEDTYRKALLASQADGQSKLKKGALTEKEKKDLDDATKALIDLSLLSVPAKASEINLAAAGVKGAQDRLQELHRSKGTDEAKDALVKEMDAHTTELNRLAKPVPIADKVLTADGTEAPLESTVADAEKKRRETEMKKPRTPEERLKEGQYLFTTKGCLACHSHDGTEGEGKLSVVGEANFGPNLSRIKAKLMPETGPAGAEKASAGARRWLYQWLLNPNIHHPRTRMPVTRLEPEEALDIADWLLSRETKYEETDPAAPKSETLRRLARVYLAKAPGMTRADVDEVIPLDTSKEMGFGEAQLKSFVRDAEEHRLKKGATDDDLKWYIGKKSVSRMGCFGCHDIPGFESAKPIGTALNDWGKKDPERLAFEDADSFVRATYHILPDRMTKADLEKRQKELLARKNRDDRIKEFERKKADEEDITPLEYSEWSDLKRAKPLGPDEEQELKEIEERLESGKDLWAPDKDGRQPYEKYFYEQLEHGHQSRQGFLHLKLMEPRSYDYNRTRAWDDRLRMPQFQFARSRPHKGEESAAYAARQTREEAEAREAVMTFVLGLTAENVSPKYVARPPADRAAEVKGRLVLEKFNCIGCHQVRSGTFDFRVTDDSRKLLQVKAETVADQYAGITRDRKTGAVTKRGAGRFDFPGHSAWTGTAPTAPDRLNAVASFNPKYDPTNRDLPARDGRLIDDRGNFSVRLNEALRFTDASGVSHDIPAGETITITPADILSRTDQYGGKLVELLLPYLVEASKSTATKKEPDNARDVLPPPLLREGERVQTGWLYQFLLNPTMIRPHTVLKMPRFNMSHEEANAIVDYFVAVEKLTNPAAGMGTPHAAVDQRNEAFWHGKTQAYVRRLDEKQRDARLKALEPYEKMILEEDVLKATARRDVAKLSLEKNPNDAGLKAGVEKAEKELKDAEERVKKLDLKEPKQRYLDADAYPADGFRLLISLGGSEGACAKCHQVNGKGGLQAPSLDLAADRLRPEWTRKWIANPRAMFAYDVVMPDNYKKNRPGEWENQELFVGPDLEQVTAVRDVLMNLPWVIKLPANRYYDVAPAGGK